MNERNTTDGLTQEERRLRLIELLLAERGEAAEGVPDDADGRRLLLRGLLNVRPPEPASAELLALQDAYLQERNRERGVVTVAETPVPDPAEPWLHLWQGDICRLGTDAVVNAANSALLGCFMPNHACIDNCIHTFAGIQLRLACDELMSSQDGPEPTGRARVTPAFNLPSRHVIHTVGPVVAGRQPTGQDRELLASCYTSCLDAALAAGCRSIAFCCISTGVFGYPNREAAEVAVDAVRAWKSVYSEPMEVVFDVFLDVDLEIYRQLLAAR